MLLIEKDRKTRTAIVCPIVKSWGNSSLVEDVDFRKLEAQGLVTAMGQMVAVCDVVKLDKPTSGLFFGKGTIERFRDVCKEHEVELLVVDATLSPVQQRNLEKALDIKVIDRTAVILEIFGRRANTKEGKLQVELAHLTYQRGRLVRSWTHLERQRGGGGFLGGPGETQIELDRRHIDNRILRIKKELEKVKLTRSIQRSARVKVPYPTVALVGYTNAGKSTLFNYVTKAEVFAKDMLFATLDPTMRKIVLDSGNEVILSDTVGFISNLPHELVMAFRATLEEVLQADIIVHVIDVSNSQYKEQKEDVLTVLHELGLTKIEYEDKYVEVYNKVDALEEVERGHWLERKGKNAVALSALTGDGVDNFLGLIDKKFAFNHEVLEIVVDLSDGKKIAEVYEKYKIIEKKETEDKFIFKVITNRR